MREKQLPTNHGGESLVNQWFNYKNQVEIKVIFMPLISCRLPVISRLSQETIESKTGKFIRVSTRSEFRVEDIKDT